MTTPTISVIIPAYNQARYITEAVNSVLAQTYPNFELIVVDDGSTDETPQILASFADPRMRIIRQPNAGLSAARNKGISESKAPFVTFLDSDDFFYPEKLEALYTHLTDHPETGLVCGGTQYIDQDGLPLTQSVKSPGNLDQVDFLLGNPFCVSAVLLRRQWLDQVGLFDESLRACEDWDLWLRLLFAGCRFAWVEKIVVAYRFHGAQMTREYERMRKAMLTVFEKFFQQPGLNGEVQALKGAVFASAMIHASAYAYNAGLFENGQQDLLEAIRLDPAMAKDQYRKMVDGLLAWSSDPKSGPPASFLEKIYRNPPPGHAGLILSLRRAIADVLLAPLFTASTSDRRRHRKELLKIIAYKPAWLLNRGVLRIILDAFS